MSFLKEHLALNHYDWQNPSALYEGTPTRRYFDRSNGFQVLFLINSCTAFLDAFTTNVGRDIEARICSKLPLEVRSEVSVFRWLRSSFFDEWISSSKD